MSCKRKAVFLDRDGTINIEKHYLYRTEDFEFIEGVPEAIALLRQRGYLAIVVTNQAGVARGMYTERQVDELHRYINGELRKRDTQIDGFYYCPHHPTAGIGKYRVKCNCRKPETGLLERACRDFGIEKDGSWVVGDKSGDIESGKRFGLKTILVRTGYGRTLEEEGYREADYIADDLYQAVKTIIR